MNYLTFREKMHPYGCFHINQVLLWAPNFDRNNLTRWCKRGLLVKLCNEHYAFPDYKQVPNFSEYVANRIYMPSYISLHYALSFYGMIPEEVITITSVTTLKTNKIENSFGLFTYQNMKTPLFFGYAPKTLPNNRSVLLATPEKALLDLLYLNSYYKTEEDMSQLRLDEDFIQTELNRPLLTEYLERIGSKSLNQRMKTLMKVYAI